MTLPSAEIAADKVKDLPSFLQNQKTLSSGLCLWFWPNRESRNWPQHRESPSTILGHAILYHQILYHHKS